MATNEWVALMANIALTLSVIVAVIFGIAQVKTAAHDRRERLTIDTLNRFQTREFAEMLHTITGITQAPLTWEEWRNWPKEHQVLFIHLSQQMESLGLLLAGRLINIDLVDRTLGSFVSNTWNAYKPLVLNMRERMDDPFLNEYFQWMAEQIENRMARRPRRPFFTSKFTAV